MIPRKDKFRGEYKLIPVAKKMKRFLRAEGAEWKESELSDFILNPKESDMILNPPALPVYEVDNTTTTIDFPAWATLSCDEILKAIEKLKFTMTVIRVDEATYNMYLSQIAFGEDTYAKKCTGGIKTPVDETPICADNEILTDVTECPDCLKSDPPCALPCRTVKKCVPKTGGGDTGGGVILGGGLGLGPIGPVGPAGGGGGAEEEKKVPYSWLWLVFMAAGVYVLTRKSE
jgi:hypothetical protein